MSRSARLLSLCAALFLALMLCFGLGFVYRHYALWPTDQVVTLIRQGKAFLRTGLWGREEQYAKATVSEGEARAKILDPERFLQGYRALLLFDADLGTYSIRLLDSESRQVHVWPISYLTLLPGEATEDVNPHGMMVLADGSILVNFGRRGAAIARLDSCSRPMWIAQGSYHHSIELDDSGALWTWGSPDHHESNLQSIMKLDADTGKILREIQMQSVFNASADNVRLLRLSEDFEFLSDDQNNPAFARDVFHPNDVEPLSAEMADQYPGFEAGDLLLSLRNLDMVAVLDPETLAIRWAKYGPWRRQHDPDFIGDGLIDVYDNNPQHGRSNIVTVSTLTGETQLRWQGEDSRFYSVSQGKHQRLPNGDHLVVVPAEGRIIELTDSGKKVFEYNNIATDGANAIVLNAQWVPPDYFVAKPACTVDLSERY
ncbi:arylsulfotransferase family protein [Defluviimonas aestuarii]|uniref:arylsulfotransferase family protein n=1 Tax=Albidovulum aestuarii TaxID=1130726 RepID=UPI00249C6BAD|nr:arylsulfotransferase family protein [Defluviimonas aestuarii]MDI3336662.1 arylsulfotransferase family protein [Defluviimonas aestuarii]